MINPPRHLTLGYRALFLLLPFTVEVDFGAWSLGLPSEPLIGALALALVPEAWRNRDALWKNAGMAWRLGIIWLGWMAVAAVFSSIPVVSWKFVLVETAHAWVFGAGLLLFPGLWTSSLPYFLVSMLGVEAYTLMHHAFFSFRSNQAMLAPMPFFPDHTLYAAVLTAALCLMPLTAPIEGNRRWLYILPVLALVAASSRAAWLSLLGAAWFTALFTKPRLRPALLGIAFVFGSILFFIKPILSTDISALERLNRWQCAVHMAADRPITGFGPGTFMFEYFEYQRPENMTRISVTKPIEKRSPENYGRGGGAHSEYFQALAETGWPGMFLWFVFIFVALLSVFRQPMQPQHLFFGLALVSFLLHALVNNFLHDARMALVFWGVVAHLRGTNNLSHRFGLFARF